MPTSNSAKKRLRQNESHRLRNRSAKRTMRTQLSKVYEAIESGNVEQSETEFRSATQKLDQAAASRIIHPNAAARTKSRISAKIKALKQG